MYFSFRHNATAKIQIIFVMQQGTDDFFEKQSPKVRQKLHFSIIICAAKIHFSIETAK